MDRSFDVVRGYGWITPDNGNSGGGGFGGSGGFGGNVGSGVVNCSPGNMNWVSGSHGSAPEDAVRAGHDLDGGTILAGRAYHQGDLLPAKVTPSHGCAFVAYGGQEHSKLEYEVLVCRNVTWKGASNGGVPSAAIDFGTTKQGEKLYMGRVEHKGTLTPGKVHPDHKVLYIPYNGKELSFREYEVLCFG